LKARYLHIATSLQKLFLNVISLQKAILSIMESVGEQFFTRFSKIRALEEGKIHEVSRQYEKWRN